MCVYTYQSIYVWDVPADKRGKPQSVYAWGSCATGQCGISSTSTYLCSDLDTSQRELLSSSHATPRGPMTTDSTATSTGSGEGVGDVTVVSSDSPSKDDDVPFGEEATQGVCVCMWGAVVVWSRFIEYIVAWFPCVHRTRCEKAHP